MIDINQFAEFGILGIIIGVLFTVMILGFKIFMRHLENTHDKFKDITIELKKEHSEDLKMMTSQHKEERTLWGIESDKRDQRYEASFKEFSRAIEGLRDKV